MGVGVFVVIVVIQWKVDYYGNQLDRLALYIVLRFPFENNNQPSSEL